MVYTFLLSTVWPHKLTSSFVLLHRFLSCKCRQYFVLFTLFFSKVSSSESMPIINEWLLYYFSFFNESKWERNCGRISTCAHFEHELYHSSECVQTCPPLPHRSVCKHAHSAHAVPVFPADRLGQPLCGNSNNPTLSLKQGCWYHCNYHWSLLLCCTMQ